MFSTDACFFEMSVGRDAPLAKLVDTAGNDASGKKGAKYAGTYQMGLLLDGTMVVQGCLEQLDCTELDDGHQQWLHPVTGRGSAPQMSSSFWPLAQAQVQV